MFCAPTVIDEPLTASATAVSDTNGGHSTVVTSVELPTRSATASANDLASATVVLIFQFPAINDIGISLYAPYR
jgi:hypothetical protein